MVRGSHHRGPKCKCRMPALPLRLQSVQARAHGTNKHGTSQGRGTMLSTLPPTRDQLSTPGEPPGEVGPTAYTSVYWGTAGGSGPHCLHPRLLGNCQGKWAPLPTPPSTWEPPGEEGPTVYTCLLGNLQGKWAHCLNLHLLGNFQGKVGQCLHLLLLWNPGEVGPTIYLHLHLLGTSRGSGPSVYTCI